MNDVIDLLASQVRFNDPALTLTPLFKLLNINWLTEYQQNNSFVMNSAVRVFKISNRIVTSVLCSIRVQIFEIFKYLPSPISYLKKLKKHPF